MHNDGSYTAAKVIRPGIIAGDGLGSLDSAYGDTFLGSGQGLHREIVVLNERESPKASVIVRSTVQLENVGLWC